MKTGNKYHTPFEKASTKSLAEIKAACNNIELKKSGYDIRTNGNHIWIEVGKKRQQYWSPMLHLRLEDKEKQTNIKGEFAENPMLWIAFLVTQIVSIVVFSIALLVAIFKWRSGWNFNSELFLMFAMVSIWLVLYLVSESYKRKGAVQIAELHHFVDAITAA